MRSIGRLAIAAPLAATVAGVPATRATAAPARGGGVVGGGRRHPRPGAPVAGAADPRQVLVEQRGPVDAGRLSVPSVGARPRRHGEPPAPLALRDPARPAGPRVGRARATL